MKIYKKSPDLSIRARGWKINGVTGFPAGAPGVLLSYAPKWHRPGWKAYATIPCRVGTAHHFLYLVAQVFNLCAHRLQACATNIIGVAGLNELVRDGIGCVPCAIAAHL